MSNLVKAITLRATYEGNLSGLKSDIASLKSVRRQLEGTAIKIPIRLDLSSIRSDAAKAAMEYQKAFSSAMASVKASPSAASSSGMSSGGIALPTGLAGLREAAGKEIKLIQRDVDNGKVKVVQSYQQLANGIQQVITETERKIKKGTVKSREVKQVDTTPTDTLKRMLDQIQRDYGSRIGAAKGSKGDVAAVLSEQRARLTAELAKFAGLEGTSEYRRAMKMGDSIDSRLAQAIPSQARAATTANRRDYNFRTDRVIKRGDRSLQSSLKDNKEQESTAKAIQNRAVRESELNRIMDERERLIARQQARFESLARNAKASGNAGAAAKLDTAGMRIGNDLNQVKLDRTRGTNEAASKADTQALERRLSTATQAHKLDRQQLAIEESLAKATQSRVQREQKLNEVLAKRQALQRRTQNEISDIHYEATTRGNHGLAQSSSAAGSSVARQGEADLHRLTTATKSARAGFSMLDNALLKNAATFTQWYVPAQAMMGLFNAVGSGIQRSVAAERAFKTLNVVFRGSREEASLLAFQTIALAAAKGRSTTEAAESAVAWARLGLTRSQTLLGVETSLRAANVAEVSAGEATGYLTAIYKGYNLTMEQTASMLDYVNALSNRYSVTNKNLFEGIARSASIAKSAGMSFGELASIITVVSANTGRPGAEIGNSIKSLINRVRRPETMDTLKTDFGLDLKNSTGDVKTMSDILAQLAAIYPTLNREQKAHLGNLVAGSLQANRFTVIMENYTDSLIAQAKAGFDTNSSMRENSQILESVSAQIERVTTSWDKMLISFGKAGGFSIASNFLMQVGNQLDTFSKGASNPSSPQAKPTIRVDDMQTRAALATVLGNKNPFAAPKTDYTREEIEEAARRMDAANQEGNQYDTGDPRHSRGRVSGKKFLSPQSPWSILPADRMQLTGEETFGDVAKTFRDLIPQQASKDSKEALTATTKDIIEGQSRTKGYGAGAKAFDALSRDVQAKNVDMTKILRQFDDSLEIVEKLPNGMQAAAEARAQIRPLIENGNKGAASDALTGLGMTFTKTEQDSYASTEAKRQKAIEEMKKLVHETSTEIDGLWQERRNAPAEQQEALKDKIEKTNIALKDQQEKLKTLTTPTERIDKESLTEDNKASLSRFSTEAKQSGDIFGQTISGFGNTGLPDLDAKLKIGAGMIQGDILRQSLGLAQGQNAAEGDGIRSQITSLNQNAATANEAEAAAMRVKAEQLQQELNLRDAIEGKLATEISEIEKATADAERKLEIERQAAKLREAYTDGAATSAARGGRYAIGRSEGERLVSSERGAIEDSRSIMADPGFGKGSAEQNAATLGALTERITSGKQGLVSIEQRLNAATAERVNLEDQIADAQRKQTQEASKRLVLASREDQLRAAGLAAAMRSRGGKNFSSQEFQFFSQGTRQAASNFLPQSVKTLDDNGREAAESRKKLDDEIRLLAISLKDLQSAFKPIREAAEVKGGSLAEGMSPKGSAPNANDIVKLDKTQVNLNVGGVTINLDLANEIDGLRRFLQSELDTKVSDALRNIGSGSSRIPNTAPAAGVF